MQTERGCQIGKGLNENTHRLLLLSLAAVETCVTPIDCHSMILQLWMPPCYPDCVATKPLGLLFEASADENNTLLYYRSFPAPVKQKEFVVPGLLKAGKQRPFSAMLLCEARIHKQEEGRDGG